jgi:flagellar basal body rod protein FlgC
MLQNATVIPSSLLWHDFVPYYSSHELCSTNFYLGSQVLGQRKQAKMQWLQNPNQSNLGNLNNARQEASRHFRNKKREYLKAKINELEIRKIRNKNIRELYRRINNFKKGYQPRTNIAKDENGDLMECEIE